MIYLFLDADEYLLAQRLAARRRAVGDPETADLNVTELDGQRTDAADLLYHASTMPFLAERRLVIVRGYLSHLDKRMAASKDVDSNAYVEAERLITGLAETPDFSDLVFIDAGIDKRRHLWKGFTARGGRTPGLADLIKQGVIQAEELTTPEPRQLPAWIAQTAKRQGISIDGRAVQMLATFVGPDLRRLTNELDKLAAFCAGRTITADDVRVLVSDASEALIWDLTDALSQRNPRKAMAALHDLRRGDANPFYLLTMIARQYRIMLKVKEATTRQGGNEYDIAKYVGERPYPVKKALQQCRAYRIEELEQIMERLLAADHAMKTGASPDTEIDLLVAELTQR